MMGWMCVCLRARALTLQTLCITTTWWRKNWKFLSHSIGSEKCLHIKEENLFFFSKKGASVFRSAHVAYIVRNDIQKVNIFRFEIAFEQKYVQRFVNFSCVMSLVFYMLFSLECYVTFRFVFGWFFVQLK